MYNRYIPQPDGSYRRNRMQDSLQQTHQPPTPPEQAEPICPPPAEECQPERQFSPERCAPPPPPPCRQPIGAGDFLKRLLPRNMDTGDLFVIILLLLMAGDCAEEQNTALLTLALYLFM